MRLVGILRLAVLSLVAIALTACGAPVSVAQAATCTLENPIMSGADPSVWERNGTYYLVQSADGGIQIRGSSTIAGLGSATPTTVWRPDAGTDHSSEIWAPELEFLDGQWIVYFAADDGSNDNHRIFAITAPDGDPRTVGWSFHCKIADSTDLWAIDPTVFRYQDSWWMAWSGTPDGNGGAAPQQIYIAHMSDPLHIDQDYRRLIANPDQPWETGTAAIEEGPEAWISPTGTLSIVYNADASWDGSYSLGMLVYQGGDLTDYRSYAKRGPVFSSANGLYGPGGESLPVPGKNGQNWNIFHANSTPEGGWDSRSIYAQPVGWAADGTPDFGTPAGAVPYDEAAQTRC